MFRVVLIQLVAASLAAAIAAVAGADAAASALLGGLAVCLPNGLFALKLAQAGRATMASSGAGPSAWPWLLGEFLKVALTVGLLVAVVCGYRSVVWPALLFSIGAVLLVQPAVLAWHKA